MSRSEGLRPGAIHGSVSAPVGTLERSGCPRSDPHIYLENPVFQVVVTYGVVLHTDEHECLLKKTAGRKHDRGGTEPPGTVLRVWLVKDFVDAVEMRRRLSLVPGVRAVVRED